MDAKYEALAVVCGLVLTGKNKILLLDKGGGQTTGSTCYTKIEVNFCEKRHYKLFSDLFQWICGLGASEQKL